MIRTLLIIALVITSGISYSQSERIKEKDVKKLVKTMAGEFSSEEQSKSDTDYFNIKLRMKPIWQNTTDGYWLYVEQATATAE